MKTEALCWLRYGKQMQLVCTEGGYWNADVLGACDEFTVEVEVKVSVADLRAEFRNKRTKHAYYDKHSKWTPNYFYFLVPSEIAEKAVEIVKEKFPKAGVLVYKPSRWPTKRWNEHVISFAKRASKLHDNKPHPDLLYSLAKRMGSELCSLHRAMDQLKGAEISELQDLKKQIIDSVVASHGTVDWEFEPDDVDTGVGDAGDGVGDSALLDSDPSVVDGDGSA